MSILQERLKEQDHDYAAKNFISGDPNLKQKSPLKSLNEEQLNDVSSMEERIKTLKSPLDTLDKDGQRASQLQISALEATIKTIKEGSDLVADAKKSV